MAAGGLGHGRESVGNTCLRTMVVEARRLPVETLARRRRRGRRDGATCAPRCGDRRVRRRGDRRRPRGRARARRRRRRSPRARSRRGLGARRRGRGQRSPCEPLAAGESRSRSDAPPTRARCGRARSSPARAGGRVVGSLELVRIAEPVRRRRARASPSSPPRSSRSRSGRSAPEPRRGARARRARGSSSPARRSPPAATPAGPPSRPCGSRSRRPERRAGRSGAVDAGDGLELLALARGGRPALDAAAGLVREALGAWRPVAVEQRPGSARRRDACRDAPARPAGVRRPAALLPRGDGRREHELPALAAFAARAAHALRAGEQRAAGRGRARADARAARGRRRGDRAALARAHARDGGRADRRAARRSSASASTCARTGSCSPRPAAGSSAGHEEVAARLLELALGPLRARAAGATRTSPTTEPALAGSARRSRRRGQRSALAVPLRVRDESIGLLVAYPGARTLGESDIALLAALAAQLAVAVQNARLHEQAKELGEALGEVLASERQAARQLSALYEISRSFAQSLSLETTLDAVTATIVAVLGVDAAVIRVPDERGDQFVPRARARRRRAARRRGAHDPRAAAARARRARQEPLLLDVASATRARRRARAARAVPREGLDGGAAADHAAGELLARADDPLARPGRADRRGHARDGADDRAAGRARDRQRTALPAAEAVRRDDAAVAAARASGRTSPGLEVGAVYESAAQVDVGGDVYDFLELADGRLAVVLGDVTGHGIDATADMAMAKFVFRSLAREHPEPSRLPRARERGRRGGDRGRQVHHDGRTSRSTRDGDGRLRERGASRAAARPARTGASSLCAAAGSRSASTRRRRTTQVRAELPAGRGRRALHRRRDRGAARRASSSASERLDALLAERAGQPAQADRRRRPRRLPRVRGRRARRRLRDRRDQARREPPAAATGRRSSSAIAARRRSRPRTRSRRCRPRSHAGARPRRVRHRARPAARALAARACRRTALSLDEALAFLAAHESASTST